MVSTLVYNWNFALAFRVFKFSVLNIFLDGPEVRHDFKEITKLKPNSLILKISDRTRFALLWLLLWYPSTRNSPGRSIAVVGLVSTSGVRCVRTPHGDSWNSPFQFKSTVVRSVMMWTLSSKRSVGLGLKNVACAKRQQEATDFPTQGTPMPGWRVSNSLKTQFTLYLDNLHGV